MLTKLKQQCPQSVLLIGWTVDEATDLAAEILGQEHTIKVKASLHSDVHYLIPDEKSGLHPISSIRMLIEETALPPLEAGRKVFLIDQAEKMLPSASNALLKALEEPREDTFFLMLCNEPEALLTTIRSRLFPLKKQLPELELMDIESLMAHAQRGEWDEVLELLPEEGAEAFFHALLHWASLSQNPFLFKQTAELVEQAKVATEHNVKLRNSALYCLLSLNTREQ